jgi:hypothetical protein
MNQTYDPSWIESIPKKRFRLVRTEGRGHAEVIFSYPAFKSLQEGLDYIREILDDTVGQYGIVDDHYENSRSKRRVLPSKPSL